MVKICYNIIRSDKVEYTVTKKKIKNFIIRIYPDLRIAVSVPLHASNKDIENFIKSKKEWIETTLEKIKIIKENKSTLKKNSIKILGKEIDKKIIESDLERIRLTDTSIYIYSKEIDNQIFKILFYILGLLDSNFNQCPSLHVSFAFLSNIVYYREIKNKFLKYFLCFWGFLLAISVLFVYQHHFIDLVGGILLFVISCVIFQRKK